MFENARKFFVENILANYNEYFKHSKSNNWGECQLLRKGINASISLYHFWEHLPPDIRPGRDRLFRDFSDYELVRDIANVAKHKRITRYIPKITNANQIQERKVIILFSDSKGEYSVSVLEVYLKLDDGTEYRLANVLWNVMSMWRDLLIQLNIVGDIKFPKPINLNRLVIRSTASKFQEKMQLMQGEEYNLPFQLLRYNYQKGRAEPEDLTGASINFTAYKLPKYADIQIVGVNEVTKREIVFDFRVPLTKHQAKRYVRLKTVQEKNIFVKSIVDNDQTLQKELIKMIREAVESKNKEDV